MFTVRAAQEDWFGFDEEVVLFTGTLEECEAFFDEAMADADDFDDDLYIMAPDGFTIVG